MSRNDKSACTTVRLPFATASASVARRMLTDALEQKNVRSGVVEDAQLVITELVANGVLHGAPNPDQSIEVGWSVGQDHVSVTVADSGCVQALHVKDPHPDDQHGRGMSIIDYLCETWTVHTENGTRLTARLALS